MNFGNLVSSLVNPASALGSGGNDSSTKNTTSTSATTTNAANYQPTTQTGDAIINSGGTVSKTVNSFTQTYNVASDSGAIAAGNTTAQDAIAMVQNANYNDHLATSNDLATTLGYAGTSLNMASAIANGAGDIARQALTDNTQTSATAIAAANASAAMAAQAAGNAMTAANNATSTVAQATGNALTAMQGSSNAALAFVGNMGTVYANNQAQALGLVADTFSTAMQQDHALVGAVTGQVQQAYSAAASSQTNNQIADYRLLIFGLIALAGLAFVFKGKAA